MIYLAAPDYRDGLALERVETTAVTEAALAAPMTTMLVTGPMPNRLKPREEKAPAAPDAAAVTDVETAVLPATENGVPIPRIFPDSSTTSTT